MSGLKKIAPHNELRLHLFDAERAQECFCSRVSAQDELVRHKSIQFLIEAVDGLRSDPEWFRMTRVTQIVFNGEFLVIKLPRDFVKKECVELADSFAPSIDLKVVGDHLIVGVLVEIEKPKLFKVRA